MTRNHAANRHGLPAIALGLCAAVSILVSPPAHAASRPPPARSVPVILPIAGNVRAL